MGFTRQVSRSKEGGGERTYSYSTLYLRDILRIFRTSLGHSWEIRAVWETDCPRALILLYEFQYATQIMLVFARRETTATEYVISSYLRFAKLRSRARARASPNSLDIDNTKMRTSESRWLRFARSSSPAPPFCA